MKKNGDKIIKGIKKFFSFLYKAGEINKIIWIIKLIYFSAFIKISLLCLWIKFLFMTIIPILLIPILC